MKIKFEIVDIVKSMDSKSLIGSILILLGLSIFGVYMNNYHSRLPKHYKELDKESKAIVYSIKNIDFTSQGFEGLKTRTVSYIVKYKYIVNSTNYDGTQELKNTYRNKKKIYYIRNNLNKWDFIVMYSSSDPNKSYLIINE